MRQLTAQEKIKVGRMIQAYNSHRNLTTIPVVLFYYYREDDSIVNEYEAAKDYFVRNCNSRDYVETMFLIRLLEENGLVYLDGDSKTSKSEYIQRYGVSKDSNQKNLTHKLLQMPEEIARTIARHYESNAYINSGLIELYNRGFKSIEEEELEQTRISLKRSKRANIALWVTLVVTILFQGANTLYDYLFNKRIPTNITISSLKTEDECQALNYQQEVENSIKFDTIKFKFGRPGTLSAQTTP